MVENKNNSIILENDNIQIELHKIEQHFQIGPIRLKNDDSMRYCADGLDFFLKNKKLYLDNLSKAESQLNLKNNKYGINIALKLDTDNYFSVSISGMNSIKQLKTRLRINFDKENCLDYIALSGNRYKNVKQNEELKFKVNKIGAFSGIWTVSSKKATIGFISIKDSQTTNFEFKKTTKITHLSHYTKLQKNQVSNLLVYLGNGDYINPIKLKFLEIEKMNPLSCDINYKEKALKAYVALRKLFCVRIKEGLIPANFIHYPLTKKEKSYLSTWCSYGNCFSLGAIYGVAALGLWDKNPEIIETLEDLIKPVIFGAQLREGETKGAFYDTYFRRLNLWTTGRVQFKNGGFSDWVPYQFKGEKGTKGMTLKEIFHTVRRDILLRKSRIFKYALYQLKLGKMTIPYMNITIEKPVVYPAYAGQFAYFLLQTLKESNNNNNLLNISMQENINITLNLTADFLIKFQKSNNIWDHELFIDGEIFWNKETLACIFPATFLIWWGKETQNKEYTERGLRALERINALHDRNEYYGMYFETNLAGDQADLVSALTCIKCYCKLYELLNKQEYLLRAEKAAWHVVSNMWSNNFDKRGKNITGGLLVTDYKQMGFPVIGGSELNQCFEVFAELSHLNSSFIIFTKALLGFCLKYLTSEGKRSLGIYEIIFGVSDDWTESVSPDFASYASGPFMRGLYLLNLLEK